MAAASDGEAANSAGLGGVFPPEAHDGAPDGKITSGLFQARRSLASGIYKIQVVHGDSEQMPVNTIFQAQYSCDSVAMPA